MEKPSRQKELYGYTVCLIAVVTLLISANQFVRAAVNLSNPLYAEPSFGATLASFEAYVATSDKRSGPPSAQPAQRDTASVATLRARWEALRADHIARVRFDATRSMLTSALLVVLSVVFFVLHWRWLKAQQKTAAGEFAA